MELKGKKINFMGDSITQGALASENAKCFVSLIAEREGAICRNYGIGGTRIARVKTPTEPIYDQDFCGRVDEMDADADVIVVFGGTNDYGGGDAVLGEFSDRTVYTFYGALHELCTSLINRYPESDIVFMTPLHRDYGDIHENAWAHKAAFPEWVKAIKEVCEYYSLPVLDLYATSGLQPALPIINDKYMPDKLHPNDAGHEILYRKVSNFLKSL